MKCPRCQYENPPRSNFCLGCGTRLGATCGACGTDLPAGSRFCNTCGTPVRGESAKEARFASPQSYTPKHLADKILTSKTALEGERKQVTVLFCDIANSTGLADRIGPEAMHDLLDRFFELCLSEVHRYEGTVNQFLGDGFMALFGAPVAHEDDARRAVLAALGIQRRLRERRSERARPGGDDLAVRMGVNTGFVVVGRIGDNLRMDYTAIGDTTNLAARLQQLAEPGAILLGETTHRMLHGATRAERLAPVQVKGKAEPVTAYRLVGLAPRRSPVEERDARTLAEFVGREREMAVLRDLWTQVAGEQGQVVGIAGEPGIGKSRLLYEFRRALGDTPVTVLEGRCVSYGASIPYLPWLDILRNNCGIVDSDGPEAVAEKVAAGLHEVGMAAESAMYLLHLLGVKEATGALEVLSPDAIKARTFETLRMLSLKGSRRSPIVLLIEDLHWIDETSEEYLAFFIESLTAAPIFLVTTYRPGYRPPWIDRSYATHLSLRPLAREPSLAVVRSMVRSAGMTSATSETILTKAEGNPFFLEELALAMAEGRGSDQVVPDTVQGVIMARIDRLSDGAKRLVQTAAVLGREFPSKLLDKVWGGTGALHPHLLELKRLEFLYESAGGEEPVYVFKHALTQDVAYDGLLTHRRQAVHGAAARALEELYADRLEEHSGSLAYHYARSEFADKAVHYLGRVADKAARVYANAEALTHLGNALMHLERLPEGLDRDRLLIDVVLRQGFSLYFLGRFQESVDVLLRHRDRLEALHDPAAAGPYHFWLAHMYTRLGNQDLAGHSAHRAIEEATRGNDRATLGKAHGLLALYHFWGGKPAQGLEHGTQAEVLLAQTAQHWWLGMAHCYVAFNHLVLGQFAECEAAASRARAVGETIGDPRLQCYAAFTIGWMAGSRGDRESAVDACERSRKLSADPVSRAYATAFLGLAHVETGDAPAAIPLLQSAVSELERFGLLQWYGWFMTVLGEAYRQRGDIERAVELATQGIDLTKRCGYVLGIGVGQRVLGAIALARGALAAAETAFTDALGTFASIDAVFEIARSRLDLARVAFAQGHDEAARTHVREAHRAFVQAEAPVYVRRAEELAAERGVPLR